MQNVEDMSCAPIPNKLLANCQLVNHRDDIITRLPGGQIIVEVGVLAGDFSELLLAKAKKLYLIDLYQGTDWPWQGRFGPKTHYQFVEQRFAFTKQVKIMKGNSFDVLGQFPDVSCDIIYIDGDHSYAVVKKDLQVAYKKLRSGGLLWVNDYTTYDPVSKIIYGVQKATNEIINQYQMPVVYFALNNSNYHDICLRKP